MYIQICSHENICDTIYVSIHPSVRLPSYTYIHLSMCLSIRLSIYLSVCLSKLLCLSNVIGCIDIMRCIYLYMYICLYVYVYVYVDIPLYAYTYMQSLSYNIKQSASRNNPVGPNLDYLFERSHYILQVQLLTWLDLFEVSRSKGTYSVVKLVLMLCERRPGNTIRMGSP